MRRAACLTALGLLFATPAFAQHHPHHPMPAQPTPEHAAAPAPAPAPASTPESLPEDDAMPAMDWPTELPPGDAPTGDMDGMSGMEGMDHSAHGVTDEDVGSEPPPPAPTDHPADAIFGEAAMRPSRDQLRVEHGGSSTWMVLIDQAEWRARDGEDGFAWSGEAWFGGDGNRLVVKSEGEGSDGDLEAAEVQFLYSRAISPYFDLQAGLRRDLQDGPKRTYVTVGVEGLAPYWFETEGALFVSNEREAFARLEGSYDLRLTQRLILQPSAEVNLSARDIPELELGSGVTDVELELRLRYQVTREFSPYVGVTYGRTFGGTADYAKAAGEDDTETSFVVGVRTWF
jgi:copper resistance protein B